jgi:hypothetical protein
LYDNVYFPGAAPHLDDNGILFRSGGFDYNLYSIGPAYYLSTDNPAGVYDPGEPVAFGDLARTDAITSAPEPSTWALMLLGFAGLALAAGRKARRSDAVLAPAIGPARKA